MLFLPVLLFSVAVHEFAHGWAAYALGDDTAERRGRLTLNPLTHLDPFGTVFVPLLCFMTGAPMFGWARPMPVRARRLRRPGRDGVWVALAGPSANLAAALVVGLLWKTLSAASLPAESLGATALQALGFAARLNLFLAFFNLVPIHPLDGAKVAAGLLPERWAGFYSRHMRYGAAIVLFVLLTHKLSGLGTWPMMAAWR